MTDPTPQTTPTRDEAAPADERRIDLPSGYYLFQIRPSDMTCSLHMPDGLHIGNLLAQYAGADFAAAMLASAPAPASSRVDAVARRAKYLLNRLETDDGLGIGEIDTMLRMAASLSPAATPVSGAGGERETVWCESCGEAPVSVRLDVAGLCAACAKEQGE